MEVNRQHWAAQVERAEQKVLEAQRALQETQARLVTWQEQVTRYEAAYRERGHPERPHSYLAQARKKVGVYQSRQARQEAQLERYQAFLQRQQAHLNPCQALVPQLEQRLNQFEQENAQNSAPIRADFRVDAGFGTPENVALLIEMGYDVYTKPYGSWLKARLKEMVDAETPWTPVGGNAEMTAWSDLEIQDFPYPLDVALEHFHTGETSRYGGLIH